MVNAVGAESCRKITHHLPIGQCRRVQRPPYLYRDKMEEVGGEVPVISWLAGLQSGSQALVILPQSVPVFA